MKKYNYIYQKGVYDIRKGTRFICRTKTKYRAKQIINMYYEKERTDQAYRNIRKDMRS